MNTDVAMAITEGDADKQALVSATAINNALAEQESQLAAKHRETFDAVVKAKDKLRATRAKIDAALDAEYGVAETNPAVAEIPVPVPPAEETVPDPVEQLYEVVPPLAELPTPAAVDLVNAV